jgi:hypothetical protein
MSNFEKGNILKCNHVNRWGDKKGVYLAKVVAYKLRRDTPIYLEALMNFSDGTRVNADSIDRYFQITDRDVHKNFGKINITTLEAFEEEFPEWIL